MDAVPGSIGVWRRVLALRLVLALLSYAIIYIQRKCAADAVGRHLVCASIQAQHIQRDRFIKGHFGFGADGIGRAESGHGDGEIIARFVSCDLVDGRTAIGQNAAHSGIDLHRERFQHQNLDAFHRRCAGDGLADWGLHGGQRGCCWFFAAAAAAKIRTIK